LSNSFPLGGKELSTGFAVILRPVLANPNDITAEFRAHGYEGDRYGKPNRSVLEACKSEMALIHPNLGLSKPNGIRLLPYSPIKRLEFGAKD
jgi:hypothetical protein